MSASPGFGFGKWPQGGLLGLAARCKQLQTKHLIGAHIALASFGVSCSRCDRPRLHAHKFCMPFGVSGVCRGDTRRTLSCRRVATANQIAPWSRGSDLLSPTAASAAFRSTSAECFSHFQSEDMEVAQRRKLDGRTPVSPEGGECGHIYRRLVMDMA